MLKRFARNKQLSFHDAFIRDTEKKFHNIDDRSQCYETFLCVTNSAKKLERFAWQLFQHGVIFRDKDSSLPYSKNYFIWVGSCLIQQYLTMLKRFAKDKRSSLFEVFVSDQEFLFTTLTLSLSVL
jgi:hypothetical protein